MSPRPNPPSLFDDPDETDPSDEGPTLDEVLELAVSLARTLNETKARVTALEAQVARLTDPCRRTGDL